MLERDSYEPKAQKLLPVSSSSKLLSWIEWRAYYLFIFAATNHCTGHAGKQPFFQQPLLAGVVERGAQKTSRIVKYDTAHALLVFAICQSAMGCDKARSVVTAHQMFDPEGSSFSVLFK
jgi:hypothetical protein